MVPRCWVPHNPIHPSIFQVAGNLDPDRNTWPKPIGKGNRWVFMELQTLTPTLTRSQTLTLTL